MRKITVLLLLAIAHIANAQNIKNTSNTFNGYINPVNSNGNATLTLSDHSFLSVTGAANSSNVTLTALDTKYSTIWQIPEMPDYEAAALLNGNVLVISSKYSKERRHYTLDAFNAEVIDANTGKVLAEKAIPVYSNQTTSAVSLLTDSKGNFKALLLRNTEQKNGSSTDYAKTNNLQVVTFDNDLTLKQQTINLPELADAQYLSAAADNDNGFCIAYVLNNNILVKKYNINTAKMEGDIKAPLNFDNEIKPISKNFLTVDNNIAYLSSKFDEKRNSRSTFIISSFNFNTNKAQLVQELEDKSYLKDADAKGKSFETINTFVYKDKFVVVKEAHAFYAGNYSVNGGRSESYFEFGPVLVSVYDNSMHKLKDFVTDEKERIYYNVPSGGVTLNGNKLFVFFNNNNWKIKSHAKYQVINLDDLSTAPDAEIALDHNLNSIMYAPCIEWFGNDAVIPMTGNAHAFGGKVQTSFATVSF